MSTFGYAVGQAPDMAAKRPLVEFLETVTDDEDDYFRRSFAALEVPADRWQNPEPTDITEAFVDLLGRAAREGGYAETLAVLVPAEWIYESWATSVAENHGDPGTAPTSAGADLPDPYAEWIDLHAVPSFVEFVAWLRGQLDSRRPGAVGGPGVSRPAAVPPDRRPRDGILRRGLHRWGGGVNVLGDARARRHGDDGPGRHRRGPARRPLAVRTIEDYITARETVDGATLTATVVSVVFLVVAVFGYVAWTLSAARRSADLPSSSAGE